MAEKVVIGNAELWHGDCREVLPMLPACDALLTDPPYGVGLAGKRAKKRDGTVSRLAEGYASTDDTPKYVRQVVVPSVIVALWKCTRGAVIPGTRSMFMYPEPAEVGAFYSASGTGLSSWGFKCSQPIMYYGPCPYMAAGMGGRHDSMGHAYPNDANETGHPCAKPLPQMLWLVNRVSLPGERLLDIFMGSGTTGVACAQLGRAFIGIEIEREYFDIACERISRAQAQGTLLPHEPARECVQEGLL